jgi:hypothetical protein
MRTGFTSGFATLTCPRNLNLARKWQGCVRQVLVGTDPHGVLRLPFPIGGRARVWPQDRPIPFPAMQRGELIRGVGLQLVRQPAVQEQVTWGFDHPGQRDEKRPMAGRDRSFQFLQVMLPLISAVIRYSTEAAAKSHLVVVAGPVAFDPVFQARAVIEPGSAYQGKVVVSQDGGPS